MTSRSRAALFQRAPGMIHALAQPAAGTADERSMPAGVIIQIASVVELRVGDDGRLRGERARPAAASRWRASPSRRRSSEAAALRAFGVARARRAAGLDPGGGRSGRRRAATRGRAPRRGGFVRERAGARFDGGETRRGNHAARPLRHARRAAPVRVPGRLPAGDRETFRLGTARASASADRSPAAAAIALDTRPSRSVISASRRRFNEDRPRSRAS